MRTDKFLLEKHLEKVISTLNAEAASLRPRSSNGSPGGLVRLHKEIPTIIIPDIHGRFELIEQVLNFKFNENAISDLLKQNAIQMVCLGDGIHTEVKTSDRWRKAFSEFKTDYRSHEAIDEEMEANFKTIMKIMQLKTDFPSHFHFLKGNHENILNEDRDGNHSFGKIVMEGMMTRRYIEVFYGNQILNTWSYFEKQLPLVAAGNGIVISHAQPKKHYGIEKLINYRDHPEVIEGLTWTNNNQPEEGSLELFLSELTNNNPLSNWVTGHRPIKGKFKFLENGKLIQIHNPSRHIMAFHIPNSLFEPDHLIFDLSMTNNFNFSLDAQLNF